MPRYERPLSDKERAELAQIRQNRAVRNARREIRDANYFSGAGKALIGIVVACFGLLWPLLVWHKPSGNGHSYVPDATGWIVCVVWVAIVLSAAAAIANVSKKAKTTKPKTPSESAEEQPVSEFRAQLLARNNVPQTDFERRAQALARSSVATENISDPVVRSRVKKIRAARG